MEQFFTLTNLSIAFLTLLVLTIILAVWLILLHARIRRLLRGSDGKSLESSILSAHTDIKELRTFENECLAYFTDVERRMNRSIQAVETIRFNPFRGTGEGGNQSFATALISEKGDGVVLSSLYSRDRMSVFGKPISKFESEHELTEEEQQVITAGKEKLQRKQNEK